MAIKPLALVFREVQPSPAAASHALRPRAELWIAVHCPSLALDAVDALEQREPRALRADAGRDDRRPTSDRPASDRPASDRPTSDRPASDRPVPGRAPADRRPTVVVEASRGRLRVVALNSAARARGIRPGLDLHAAFAFSGALRVLERSRRAEQSLLEALAAIAHRFTPSVSLEPPDGLLFEVRPSLALFGGFERLEAEVRNELSSRVSELHLSAAPTPLAALWLARSGVQAASNDRLPARLGRLPLEVTRWPDAVLDLLAGVGITTIGECLRLPRDGLARRIGAAYLEQLDKSLGKRADPRGLFKPPKHLDFEVELLDESTSLPVFVDAATRMVEHLARELKVRQAQIDQMQLVFEHSRLASTVHRIELLESTAHGPRLLELLCDKLERIALPAPAKALCLRVGPLEPAAPKAGRLFKGEGGTNDDERARLVERLRGRLGASAVRGVAMAADHRPERAWIETEIPGVLRRAAAGRSLAEKRDTVHRSVPIVERPLWLMPEPAPLPCIDGKPHLDAGRLRILEGPERIESGWWDGEGISRDYFVAIGPNGERLWVFRDRADRRWYLHGRFG